jgi:hypothetical protein
MRGKEGIQDEAQRGAKEFKVITASVLRLANLLGNQYRFILTKRNLFNQQPLNARSLQNLYNSYLSEAKRGYLAEQLKVGEKKTLQELEDEILNNKDLGNHLKLGAWRRLKGQLVEWLSYMVLLGTTEDRLDYAREVTIYGENEVQPLRWGNKTFFLWKSSSVDETKSGMSARPDIAISISPQPLSPENIRHVVECKCVDKINSSVIRTEFGKAYDLAVSSYTIVSYYRVESKYKNAAEKLGIDIIPLNVDSILEQPVREAKEVLVSKLNTNLKSSISKQMFQKALTTKVATITKKLSE